VRRRAVKADQARQHLDHALGADRAATSMAKHSCVNSSTAVKHLICRPSAVDVPPEDPYRSRVEVRSLRHAPSGTRRSDEEGQV
jgi:hypothetical protein